MLSICQKGIHLRHIFSICVAFVAFVAFVTFVAFETWGHRKPKSVLLDIGMSEVVLYAIHTEHSSGDDPEVASWSRNVSPHRNVPVQRPVFYADGGVEVGVGVPGRQHPWCVPRWFLR